MSAAAVVTAPRSMTSASICMKNNKSLHSQPANHRVRSISLGCSSLLAVLRCIHYLNLLLLYELHVFLFSSRHWAELANGFPYSEVFQTNHNLPALLCSCQLPEPRAARLSPAQRSINERDENVQPKGLPLTTREPRGMTKKSWVLHK